MTKVLIIIALFLLSGIQSSWAYKVGSLDFSENEKVGDSLLPLRGAGLKKFLGIQIVAVALYLPEGVPSKDVLSDCPKRLEVVYLQNIPKEELQRATSKGVRINVSKTEYQDLEPKIRGVNDKYVDVRKGDKIVVDYLPGLGLQVTVNQENKGIIKGADIARAFFAIWVGDHPVDANMKDSLLGGRNE